MVTQRLPNAGKLGLIQTTLGADRVCFSAPSQTPLQIDIPRTGSATVSTKVHSSDVRGLDCGKQAATWFTEYLREIIPEGVRLLWADPSFRRVLSPTWVDSTHTGTTLFADGYPLLVANARSLAELNRRIEMKGGKPIPITRFRPNIVLDGLDPFAEDSLAALKFPAHSSLRLRFIKPCERCLVTTIDQDTGEPADKEPLATLAKFRRWAQVARDNPKSLAPRDPNANNNVMFGMNAIVEGLGEGEIVNLQVDSAVEPIPA